MAQYPAANKTVIGKDAGSFVSGYAKKGILHTTEGSKATGAFSAYKKNNSWPHFTVDRDTNYTVYQHVDTAKASRSLRNLSGGVETNRGGAIQIEVVGFAHEAGDWPTGQIEAVKNLMRWIESTSGVKPEGPGRPFASSYGQNHLRFTNAEWKAFNAWCGHSHVVENSHWDPGAIDISTLLPTPPDSGFQVPASYFTEVNTVPFSVPRSQGGYILVGGDGGVFTYEGAPFHGSLGGVPLASPVVAATWTPSGNGYWLLGADGGVFTFGDAPFHGGLNGSPHLGNRKPIGIVSIGAGYRIVTLDPSGDGSPFDDYNFGL